MNTFLQILIQYAAEIVALVMISAIGILGSYILNKINKNKNLQNIGIATQQVIDAAQETVRRLQQTVVEAWKAAAPDGKLTPEQIAQLKKDVQEITLDQLGQPVLDLLTGAKIDVLAMITNAAEAYINQTKSIDWL